MEGSRKSSTVNWPFKCQVHFGHISVNYKRVFGQTKNGQCYQMHGMHGGSASRPVCRWFNEFRFIAIVVAASVIHS